MSEVWYFFVVYVSLSCIVNLYIDIFLSVGCRCGPVHTKVPGRCSTDRVLLLTEKTSVICAETRTGGERGELLPDMLKTFADLKLLY